LKREADFGLKGIEEEGCQDELFVWEGRYPRNKLLCVDGAYGDETRVTTGERWSMGGVLAGRFAWKFGDHLDFVREVWKEFRDF
jgi:hypothetical protein